MLGHQLLELRRVQLHSLLVYNHALRPLENLFLALVPLHAHGGVHVSRRGASASLRDPPHRVPLRVLDVRHLARGVESELLEDPLEIPLSPLLDPVLYGVCDAQHKQREQIEVRVGVLGDQPRRGECKHHSKRRDDGPVYIDEPEGLVHLQSQLQRFSHSVLDIPHRVGELLVLMGVRRVGRKDMARLPCVFVEVVHALRHRLRAPRPRQQYLHHVHGRPAEGPGGLQPTQGIPARLLQRAHGLHDVEVRRHCLSANEVVDDHPRPANLRLHALARQGGRGFPQPHEGRVHLLHDVVHRVRRLHVPARREGLGGGREVLVDGRSTDEGIERPQGGEALLQGLDGVPERAAVHVARELDRAYHPGDLVGFDAQPQFDLVGDRVHLLMQLVHDGGLPARKARQVHLDRPQPRNAPGVGDERGEGLAVV
mmetsp:Transcript_62291/g.197266  ORF Transcript_62291/g.197266 Transcript_62291/m.197266 type:complete len:426 (+) Transcript_62291:884-2161(+)